MTPEEFKAAVQRLIESGLQSYDPEGGHLAYDDLMEQLLRDFGYGEGVDLARDLTRWYS